MIFSVERRRFRKGGVVQQTRFYYLRYRIGDMPADKWVSLGVTDKQVAQTQLPIYEAIKELPRLGKYTQIRAQISGAAGQNGSQAVASCGVAEHAERPVNGGFGRNLTQRDAGG